MKRYIETLLAVSASALMPIKATLILVGFCIMTDTIFGLYKAYKLKSPITSRALSAVISKMFLYEFVIIMFFAIDTIILNDLLKSISPVDLLLTRLTGVVMVAVETLSILENIKLSTGYDFIKMAKEVVSRGQSIKTELDEFKN